MPEQIFGYYTKRKEAFLKAFDRTAVLMRETLIARYGADFAGDFQMEV